MDQLTPSLIFLSKKIHSVDANVSVWKDDFLSLASFIIDKNNKNP